MGTFSFSRSGKNALLSGSSVRKFILILIAVMVMIPVTGYSFSIGRRHGRRSRSGRRRSKTFEQIERESMSQERARMQHRIEMERLQEQLDELERRRGARENAGRNSRSTRR